MRFSLYPLAALALLSVVWALPASAQSRVEPERYSAIRLAAGPGFQARLAAAGVALGHAHPIKTAAGPVLHTVVGAAERTRLDAAGIAYTVEVDDLVAAYAARPVPSAARLAAADAAKRVDGFGYGSMGGYYTLAEVEEKLDEMAAQYPELVTQKQSIGTTHEGRDVWQVWISDNPGVDEGEPEALYTAIHHAREPNSMAAVVYFMFYLLENYGTDPEVTYLVDNRRLAFVPVLNPDGYAYNELIQPNGGGLWRKNRRANGDGTFGVDLNRNYDFEWGYDDAGSSPFTESQTYRGPAPFSEPETQAIRDFIDGQSFGLAFNYHTYSDLLIYPWGYEANLYTPDSARFVQYADDMTRYNGYRAGTGNQTVGYLVNGVSDDWMYGDTSERPQILAMTPEVGGFDDGFWPEQDRIFALCEENVYPNLRLAWYAGGAPLVESAVLDGLMGDGLDPGEQGVLRVRLSNPGLGALVIDAREIADASGHFDVSGTGTDDVITLGTDESATLDFTIRALEDAPLGLSDGVSLQLTIGGQTVPVPVGPLLIGTYDAQLADDASSMDAWTATGGWGLTPDAFSAPTAFTESPAGEYASNLDARLTLAEPFSLEGVPEATLRFQTKWRIEGTYDFAQVLASTDGQSWTPLDGLYTTPGTGNGVQPAGQPGYQRSQLEWVEETMSLDAFVGEPNVYLQLRLRSDGSIQYDGWLVDDLLVGRLVDASAVSADAPAGVLPFALYAPAPNPSAGRPVAVRYALPEAGAVRLSVVDVLGREVAVVAEGERSAGEHAVTTPSAGLAPGVYVLRLQAGARSATRKLTVTR